MIRTIKRASLLLCFWLAACSNQTGTDTGNPTAVSVRFASLQTTGVTLTEARVVLKAIDLDPVSVCQAEAEIGDFETPDEVSDLPGPFVLDLLTDTTVPDTDPFSVPAGFYCEMDIEFDRLQSEDVPDGDDPIVGNALLARGTRGDGTTLILRLSQDDRFKLEAVSPGGFLVKNNVLTPFIVRFDLGAWFLGVPLEEAVVSDGVILLDDENNAELKALIVENIKRSVLLFQDLDNDGVLDPEESIDTLILAEGSDEPD